MNTSTKLVVMSICFALAGGCSRAGAPAETNRSVIEQMDIVNIRVHQNDVFSSGQPTRQQIEALEEAGVKHIVDLRPATETDWDEGAFVKSMGLQYHSIPVAGREGITIENARSLHQLLDSLKGEPVLVHCASGNRVGALVALAEGQIRGNDVEDAIAEGKRWGLTRLEPAVREMLSGDGDVGVVPQGN